MEIGARGLWEPIEQKIISPFAVQCFPEKFKIKNTSLMTVKAEHTFWEKITILHKESLCSQRSGTDRVSRHYYDVYRLADTEHKEMAFNNIKNLQRIVEFMDRYYPNSWVSYSDILMGNYTLIPNIDKQSDLKKDYSAMEAMLFGSCPSFDEIIDKLSDLENEIKDLVSDMI